MSLKGLAQISIFKTHPKNFETKTISDAVKCFFFKIVAFLNVLILSFSDAVKKLKSCKSFCRIISLDAFNGSNFKSFKYLSIRCLQQHLLKHVFVIPKNKFRVNINDGVECFISNLTPLLHISHLKFFQNCQNLKMLQKYAKNYIYIIGTLFFFHSHTIGRATLKRYVSFRHQFHKIKSEKHL